MPETPATLDEALAEIDRLKMLLNSPGGLARAIRARPADTEDSFDEELHEQTDTIDHRALTLAIVANSQAIVTQNAILFSEHVAEMRQARRHADENYTVRHQRATNVNVSLAAIEEDITEDGLDPASRKTTAP